MLRSAPRPHDDDQQEDPAEETRRSLQALELLSDQEEIVFPFLDGTMHVCATQEIEQLFVYHSPTHIVLYGDDFLPQILYPHGAPSCEEFLARLKPFRVESPEVFTKLQALIEEGERQVRAKEEATRRKEADRHQRIHEEEVRYQTEARRASKQHATPRAEGTARVPRTRKPRTRSAAPATTVQAVAPEPAPSSLLPRYEALFPDAAMEIPSHISDAVVRAFHELHGLAALHLARTAGEAAANSRAPLKEARRRAQQQASKSVDLPDGTKLSADELQALMGIAQDRMELCQQLARALVAIDG